LPILEIKVLLFFSGYKPQTVENVGLSFFGKPSQTANNPPFGSQNPSPQFNSQTPFGSQSINKPVNTQETVFGSQIQSGSTFGSSNSQSGSNSFFMPKQTSGFSSFDQTANFGNISASGASEPGTLSKESIDAYRAPKFIYRHIPEEPPTVDLI